jgi:porin
MLKKITLCAVLCGIGPWAYGQSEKENPFAFEASYLGDTYYNAAGGVKTGGGFMGMANIRLGFDTEKAGWWRGGTLLVNGSSIHGRSLSENYLGDLQVASNIDAGEHAYLHELWYRQALGPVSLTVGLQDLNAEFMATEGGGEFLNSSFGIPSVMAVEVPVPIFPLTGLGVTARWEIGGRLAWQAALFDGGQTLFGEGNPHNIRWRLGREEGALAVTELHLDGRYRIGAYYHSAEDETGFYVVADQPLSQRLSLFAQAVAAPKAKNENNYYLGAGLNYAVGARSTAGFAVAHAGLHRTAHKHETALEFYWKYRLNDNIALQPDLQYILNPSGADEVPADALVGILRLHVDF